MILSVLKVGSQGQSIWPLDWLLERPQKRHIN